MKIRYNPVVAIVYLVLGVVVFALGAWVMALTGDFQFGAILGPVIALLGIMMLTRPYLEFDGRSVARLALLGPARRTTDLAPGERFLIEDRKLFIVRPDGGRRPGKVAVWMAHPGDWRAATEAFARQR